MCKRIAIDDGRDDIFFYENIIETPQQFENQLGFKPEKSDAYKDIEPDLCLCQIDIEKTFEREKVEYKYRESDGLYIVKRKFK